MATLEHFLFNSDYPTDKIVFMQEGEVEVTGTWTPIYNFINTHIPAQIYAEGDYKTPGSSVVYPIDGSNSNPESNTTVVLGSFMYKDECWLVVSVFTFDSSLVGKTLTYRIWCYYDEEKAKNTDISATTNISKPKLALTSDNNYPRFLGDGFVTQGQSYSHNLGFIPLVKTWSLYENASMTMPDGVTTTVNSYEHYANAYLGDASNIGHSANHVIQVSSSQIITYTPTPVQPGDPVPSGVYFRMYKI